jgi:hypothetical protein
MFGKSGLVKALDKWASQGGDLRDTLASHRNQPVKSKAEAAAVCRALDALRERPERAGERIIGSPVHTLAAFFQRVDSKEAFEVLVEDGLPRLRAWVRDGLDDRDADKDDVMFLLKILGMYRQREDVDLIARAARKPINPDGFLWSVVLGQFDAEHPHSTEMIDALRDPLPVGFIRVAYLDMANGLAISGTLDRHPYESPAGRTQLETWLRDPNEEHFSFAHSATAALPFIDATWREGLLLAAGEHPSPSVRMEAAWAQAKSGDPAGLDKLAEYCRDPHCSHTAQRYLTELGHAARIPEEARHPDFLSIAEMAHWLAHPNEFGRAPDQIAIFDTRELFWPPTDDIRRLSLVKYTYNNEDRGESDTGVGMVGSITFALFGEATTELSPEDIYGLHCCWELEGNNDPRAPKERTPSAGRAILGQHNDGF